MTSATRGLTVATWIGAVASVAALTVGGVSGTGVQPVASATLVPAERVEAAPERFWFNRRSGVYHLKECMYYTQTKDGIFLSAEEASRIGNACGHCLAPRRRGAAARGGRKGDEPVKVYVMPGPATERR